jgi:squalene-associated FAD-dependent desaturase
VSSGHVHVVGAGLSGLSSAVWLARAGRTVQVHEASGSIGGRCRSFDDPGVGRHIDNGNHIVLSGNTATLEFLAAVGAADQLVGPPCSEFHFLDIGSGERWTVRPSAGRVPWWILSAGRRIPGSRVRDYLALARLALAGPEMTVDRCFHERNLLFSRFIEPIALAVLNAPTEAAAASLLRPVLLETFGKGEGACRPLVARDSLGSCFVDPAIQHLADGGGSIRTLHRVRALEAEGDRLVALRFADGETVNLMADDAVVLAVPPDAAADLVPGIKTPIGSNVIVNGHFVLPEVPGEPGMLGIIGGFSQWIFVRRDMASVTISGADELADHAASSIAGRMWPEVCRALNLGERPLPRYRILKEKRATFAQTPTNAALRPGARTRWRNLFLAGDWTATGLPATIEGSLRSGRSAASAVLAGAANA